MTAPDADAPENTRPAGTTGGDGRKKGLAALVGPGLLTGASDDDPSGIGTYAQVGAQFGFGMLWTMLFSYPLMVAAQLVCARIGRVTGLGLAGNLRKHMPRWALWPLVTLLLAANTINIGADLGAMGEGIHLLLPGNAGWYTVGFGVLSVVLEVLVPYHRYVSVLKWLTLALLAYVAAAFVVDVPWGRVVHDTFLPTLSAGKGHGERAGATRSAAPAAPAADADADPDARDKLQQAEAALKAHDYDRAERLANGVINSSASARQRATARLIHGSVQCAARNDQEAAQIDLRALDGFRALRAQLLATCRRHGMLTEQ